MADSGSDITSSAPRTSETGGASILDATPVSTTCQKLNGNNYLPWSRAVELFIVGRGKKEYLSEK